MTQFEFDKEMNFLNSQEQNESRPFVQQIDAINQEQNDIRVNIAKLQLKLSELTAKKHNLDIERKKICARYWQKKHELVINNPKSSMEG